MSDAVRRCSFFNCKVTEHTYLYHIVHDLYVHLCAEHARMALSAKHSTTALVEFLVALKGNSRPYRDQMRRFIIEEIRKNVE